MKTSITLNGAILCLLSLSIILLVSCKKGKDDNTIITTVEDVDGNVYHFDTIGTQVWLNSNLMTTKLNDGTLINNITDNSQWNASVTPSLCWYNNQLTNKATYGALYNLVCSKFG